MNEIEYSSLGGDTSITLAPDEKFYVCPAFFKDEKEESIGTLIDGNILIKNKHLYEQEYFPICQVCDAYHCSKCVYHNKKHTINLILKHYERYILKLSTRMIYDKTGRLCYDVDEALRRRLETKLITKTLTFKLDSDWKKMQYSVESKTNDRE